MCFLCQLLQRHFFIQMGNEVFSYRFCGLYLFLIKTTLIISKKPGNTGISRDIRTEFTTDLLLSD